MTLKYIWHECPICHEKIHIAQFLTENGHNPCMNFKKHLEIRKLEVYHSIPKEKVQRVLDNFRKGMTIGQSYGTEGLTQEEGFAIIDMNLEETYYLRREAK